MSTESLNEFPDWTTAVVSDGCVQARVDARVAPAGLRQLGGRATGLARPVRHHGSVDVFFEAIARCSPGDVLVVDNGGRLDEGCIGDLVAIEAQAAGCAGIVCWGAIRDCNEIDALGLPVFYYGANPRGPQQLRTRHPAALESALVGDQIVAIGDMVFADRDGVLFVPGPEVPRVLAAARDIWTLERRHAETVKSGISLREQFAFDDYLQRRAASPDYAFREHLRSRNLAIEA